MTPRNSNETEVRLELEKLQAELSTRSSVLRFARAAVSMTIALILAGAAGKLLWDLPTRHLYLALPVFALSLGFGCYSVVNYLKGKAALAVELNSYQALIALRSHLRLDDPAALLPR